MYNNEDNDYMNNNSDNNSRNYENGEPNNNIREDMGESQEYIGDYVLEKAAGGNDDIGYQMTYNIVNPSCNTMLNITITVNKNRDYQEYCNALVEEFAPRFEEVILSNLK